MDQPETTQEEVTTIEHPAPQQVIKKTIKHVEPPVKGEAPQKVFETKKTILRFNQVIWYILGLIDVLLVFRFALKALGANPFVGFTSFIYFLTNPLVAPFNGIINTSAAGSSVMESATIIAAIVYLCFAWGLVYLVDLIYPITPTDVGTQ